jgi:hypothetical protein
MALIHHSIISRAQELIPAYVDIANCQIVQSARSGTARIMHKGDYLGSVAIRPAFQPLSENATANEALELIKVFGGRITYELGKGRAIANIQIGDDIIASAMYKFRPKPVGQITSLAREVREQLLFEAYRLAANVLIADEVIGAYPKELR